MVSIMESSSPDNQPGPAPADELQHLERASANPTIAAMPVPTWVWPVVAVIGWAYAYGQTLDDATRLVLTAGSMFALVFLSSRMLLRHGATPKLTQQPRRLTLLRVRWLVESIILVLGLMYVGWKVNKWIAVAVSGPAFALISYLHDRRAEAATAQMRAAQAR